MNKLVLLGNVAKVSEIALKEKGASPINFTVAVQRYYDKAKGEPVTDFIDLTLFVRTEAQANFLQENLVKGRLVSVEAAIHQNNYTDKNGIKRYGYQFVTNNISFPTAKKQQQTPKQPELDGIQEELPF